MNVYEWPRDWYEFASATFRLKARSQVTQNPWTGASSIYGPHVQLWTAKFVLVPQFEPVWQAMGAFISRLNGQANLIRIGHIARVQPQYNREAEGSIEGWSDSTFFSDGTGFESGLIPPTAYVAQAAGRGDNFVVIGGLPVSLSRALRRGDLFEIRPNGIAGQTPMLHEIMHDGTTDADGRTGVEIRPILRAGIGFGDTVVLEYPTSVFRLIDDDQGSMELTPPVIASMGFELIEAVV